MIPNTYRWLQSVCLPLPPSKHLNSRTLWWVEGWEALLHVFLLRHTPPSPFLFSIFFPFISSHRQSKNFSSFALFRRLTSCDWSCFYFIFIFISLASPGSPIPPPSPFLQFSFLLASHGDMFACSCEGVSDVCVAHRGRGSSRAWREHTLWELPFRTTFSNEQQAGWKTEVIFIEMNKSFALD